MNCNYADQGLYIGSTPGGDTQIAMCCWQEKRKVDSVSMNHEYLEIMRTATHLPSQCSAYCKQPGHVANERERCKQDPWWTNGVKIKKLHLEQSLVCNLACISCSSRYSSKWNQWYREFEPTAELVQIKKQPENVWQHLDLSEVEHIHFTGGEPLLNPDNKKILQHLDGLNQLENCAISYCTNGTIFPDKELIELWHKAKWIRLFVSLDGADSTFEYTRWPANWTQVQSNISAFRNIQGPCILIEVDAIVGIHNLWNMPDFVNWWTHNCRTGNQGDPSQIFVRCIEPSSKGGELLQLQNLPESLIDDARETIISIQNIPGALGLLQGLGTNPNNNWIQYLDTLDLQRKTNWRHSLTGPITTLGK